jgi:integrase/recombinase XerD
MKAFQRYFIKREYAYSTIMQHKQNVSLFFTWLKTENISIRKCGYSEMIRFLDSSLIGSFRFRENKRYINRILNSVTYYFDFLAEKTKSMINPARYIRIKSNDKRLVHDLLDYNELLELYSHNSPRSPRQVRNRVILGFIIFQGLTAMELQNLKIEDIRFEEGNVLIREGYQNSLKKGTASRILALEAIQMVDLIEYLRQIRPKILAGKYLNESGRKPISRNRVKRTNQVILSLKGSPHLKNTLHHLFIDLKKNNIKVKSGRQLRQSIIAHWLTKYNLRKVQYLAGHRYVSSTEWYKGNNLEALKREVDIYHPLKLKYSRGFQ